MNNNIREIYIVRHGQTDYNLKGIVQGRGVNSSLNETGRSQARAFYDHYGRMDFDILYISTLKRTHQTMDQFLRNGQAHVQRAAIDEIDWGIYEGVAHDADMHERYLSIIDRWRNDELEIKIEGGESAMDLHTRLLPFVEELRNSGHKRVLVCSHGRTIRVLLCALTGTPVSRMDDFPHTNTAVYKLDFDGTGFTISMFNNTDHLNGAL